MTQFVLVAGAWLGAWAWNRVTPLLESQGHSVNPVTLTGMGDRVHLASKELGIETAIQDVLNVMTFEDLHEAVLVGHSFAGKVVAATADRSPDDVQGIIYLDAFRPSKVRGPQGSFDPNEFGALQPAQWSIPLTERVLDAVGKDITEEDRAWMMSKATPWPSRYATDAVELSKRFDQIRSAFILCTQGGDPVDDIVSGRWGRLDGPHAIIDSGHWPMITRPEELAADLMRLSEKLLP